MLERNAAQLDVAATLSQTSGLHPREVVHALGAAVLRTTGGDLRDDATVVVLDWYGGPLRRRESTHGASQQHASPQPTPCAGAASRRPQPGERPWCDGHCGG
jgi:hypothetical protein